jgi:hypothetical protein
MVRILRYISFVVGVLGLVCVSGCLGEMSSSNDDLGVGPTRRPTEGEACERVGELVSVPGGFCFCGNDHDWHCADPPPATTD